MPAFHIGNRLPNCQPPMTTEDDNDNVPHPKFASSSSSTTPKVGRKNVTTSAPGPKRPGVKKATFIRRAASKLSLCISNPPSLDVTEHPARPSSQSAQSRSAPYPPAGAVRPYMPRHHSPAVQAALRERGLLAPANDLSKQEAASDARLDRLAQAKGHTQERGEDGQTSAAQVIEEEWHVRNRAIHQYSSDPGSANHASKGDPATGSSPCRAFPEHPSAPEFRKAQKLADLPQSGSCAEDNFVLPDELDVPNDVAERVPSMTATVQPTLHPPPVITSKVSVPNHAMDSRPCSTTVDEGKSGTKRGRRSLAKLTTLSNLMSGRSRLPKEPSLPPPPFQVIRPVLPRRVAVNPTMHSAASITVETRGILDDESRRLTELAFMS